MCKGMLNLVVIAFHIVDTEKVNPNKTLRSVDRHVHHNYKYWYDLTVIPSLMVCRLTFTYALYLPEIFQMDYWVKIRLFWENVKILIIYSSFPGTSFQCAILWIISAMILVSYGTGHYVMNDQRAVR